MAALEWNDRQIMTLRRMAREGFTSKETAERLTTSQGSVIRKAKECGTKFTGVGKPKSKNEAAA